MPEARKLYSVRFSRESLQDPEFIGRPIYEGVEYIVADRQVDEWNKHCADFGVKGYESVEEVQLREWDRTTSLNGKRCLFVSLGGIGDGLSHTALIGHAKRLYPTSSWDVFCSTDITGNVWVMNPHIENMMPKDFPIPKELWDRYDYHFSLFGLIAAEVTQQQNNFYDTLSEWMFGAQIPEQYKRPEIYIKKSEPLQTWKSLLPKFPFENEEAWNGTEKLREGHIVVQLNASKQNRNLPIETWIGFLKKIQREYPNIHVFIFGEGKYAHDFTEVFCQEIWFTPNVQQQLNQFTFSFYSKKPEYDVVTFRAAFRQTGDLSSGTVWEIKNQRLTFRGAAVLVRDASIVVAPDSAFAHLAGANGIQAPCVSLFGAFAPKWRVTTYPKNKSIYKPETCVLAPCAHHGIDTEFPANCPAKDCCVPMEQITVDDIMNQVKEILDA